MIVIRNERPQDAADIEHLYDTVFGADRKETRTVYRLREGISPLAELCFVVREGEALVACLRFWPVTIGLERVAALLLGPIAVAPKERGRGLGHGLMRHGLMRAGAGGHRIVVLVGDQEYYGRFGFRRELATELALPGPVDAKRLLAAELVPGALDRVGGMLNPCGALERDLLALSA